MRNDNIFKSWRDIKDWAEANGYPMLAKRLQLNNNCWASSGEFGRNQVYLCDSMREAEDLHEVAAELEAGLKYDPVLTGDWSVVA